MSNPKWVEKTQTLDQRLGHLMEELFEAGKIGAKIFRFGWYSYNPDVPKEERFTNRELLEREIADVELAIKRLREQLIEEDLETASDIIAKDDREWPESVSESFAQPRNVYITDFIDNPFRRDEYPHFASARVLNEVGTDMGFLYSGGNGVDYWYGYHPGDRMLSGKSWSEIVGAIGRQYNATVLRHEGP